MGSVIRWMAPGGNLWPGSRLPIPQSREAEGPCPYPQSRHCHSLFLLTLALELKTPSWVLWGMATQGCPMSLSACPGNTEFSRDLSVLPAVRCCSLGARLPPGLRPRTVPPPGPWNRCSSDLAVSLPCLVGSRTVLLLPPRFQLSSSSKQSLRLGQD